MSEDETSARNPMKVATIVSYEKPGTPQIHKFDTLSQDQ